MPAARPVRVRYAPSPTGQLHLGGLRTALFNFLFARRHGGQYLLRIEDTDQTRKVEGSVDSMIAMLRWAGINHDEGPDVGGAHGPYTQSERLHLYREHADTLLESGHAYRCFCTPERLDALRQRQAREGAQTLYDRACLRLPREEVRARLDAGEAHVVRLKVPAGSTLVHDAVRGAVRFQNSGVDDQVLVKSDGFPTYHLACVVDDHLMRISHVLRGEEWLPSTAKHAMMYDALGWPRPTFAHLPLLLNPDRTKLSKRQGDVSVEDFKAQGWLPEALVNFVAFLGWSPASGEGEQPAEVMDLDALVGEVRQFSLDRVHKAGAVVDRPKLAWFNQQHIRRLIQRPGPSGTDRVRDAALPHVQAAAERAVGAARARGVPCSELESPALQPLPLPAQAEASWTRSALLAAHERARTFEEFGRAAYFLFAPPVVDDEAAIALLPRVMRSERAPGLLREAREALAAAPAEQDGKAMVGAVKAVMKARKAKPAEVLMPLRFALTGADVGMELADLLGLLQRDRAVARVDDFLAWFEARRPLEQVSGGG